MPLFDTPLTFGYTRTTLASEANAVLKQGPAGTLPPGLAASIPRGMTQALGGSPPLSLPNDTPKCSDGGTITQPGSSSPVVF